MGPSDATLLPVILGSLPPVLSILFGTTEGTDLGLFLLSLLWLYVIAKKPEEIFSEAEEAMKQCIESGVGDERLRKELNAELLKALLYTIIAPVIGAAGVYLLTSLCPEGRLMGTFNPRLYVIAAGLRPFVRALNWKRDSMRRLGQALEARQGRNYVAPPTPPGNLAEVDAVLSELHKVHARVNALERRFATSESSLEQLSTHIRTSISPAVSAAGNAARRATRETADLDETVTHLSERIAHCEQHAAVLGLRGPADSATWFSLLRPEWPTKKFARALWLILGSLESAEAERQDGDCQVQKIHAA